MVTQRGFMKAFINFISLFTLYLSVSSMPAFADADRGKVLHDQSCMGCHNTSVYQRPNRQITTLAALHAQVQRCTKPAGAEWSREDMNDVTDYLNLGFYHFKQ